MKETLKVTGMSCGHCVSSIEGALAEQQVKAKVDLAGGTVEVEFTEDITKDQIVEVIEELGYEVK